ncbi:MAG: toll/interleukin-1 receptor domain-containing protein [Oscillospiraceae bacterium]|nr:toll/interleukin-1 receptor domain-containing protein [Oscillospiraceae bacterium]
MKVFISWSGDRSHAVAIALKDFIEDIIPSVDTFVSDKDIVSGERWNQRLERELRENEYGILCVTRDNMNSRWLLFEAGALSNLSIPVVPYLFDLEPSDLTGSPLLQFQSSIYRNADNAKKLIKDIHDACGKDKREPARLDRAFEVWYQKFEDALVKIVPVNEAQEAEKVDATRTALAEILAISRSTQMILSGSESSGSSALSSAIGRMETLLEIAENGLPKTRDAINASTSIRQKMLSELEKDLIIHGDVIDYAYKLLMLLSLYRDDFPWIYDAGKEVVESISRDISPTERHKSYEHFYDLLDFALENPIIKGAFSSSHEYEQFRDMLKTARLYIARVSAAQGIASNDIQRQEIKPEQSSQTAEPLSTRSSIPAYLRKPYRPKDSASPP